MTAQGAAVIVEDQRGRVLLLLRGPTAPWMPNRWNLPGGKVEAGEAPYEAAIREAREETGLRVHSLEPYVSTPKLYVYRAIDWTGRVRLDDREHTRAVWVPKEVAWSWKLVPAQSEILRGFAGR